MIDVYEHIGKVIARKIGAEPVSTIGIRRYVEAHELTCPVYYDAAAARAAGHEDVIAPYGMLLTMAMSEYWKPGDAPLKPGVLPPFAWSSVVPEGWEALTNKVEVEYFAALALGDVVHSEYRITGVTPKRTSIGDGEFIDFEVTFTNQHGRKIAVERTAVYRYQPFATAAGAANG